MKQLSKDFVDNYDWSLYPEAEEFLNSIINDFLKNNKKAAQTAKKMESETSTYFFDWIDHITIPSKHLDKLKSLGFKEAGKIGEATILKIANSTLFPVLITKDDVYWVALKPEDMDIFASKIGKYDLLLGEAYSSFREMIISKEGKYVFSAVERRGSSGFAIEGSFDAEEYKDAIKAFEKRKRAFSSEAAGMAETRKLVEKIMNGLSPQRTADAFFRAERSYWQKKNRAGQTQYARQNSLGLGWGNHDHHTYRSSRENFKPLIELFELMGYKCRERFYAGEKAGWGAQILEHPQCDIVLFADVDITNEEKDKDFAHSGLHHINKLGTVGLWIGLHGESLLEAGMHHLEARFNFESLREDLKKKNINTMNPFSNFAFLKQAFTEGEHWPVNKRRADILLSGGSITKEQHDEFIKKGAIGSHMENLQRRQGYKGFNQNSVSAIIKATNPLKQLDPHTGVMA